MSPAEPDAAPEGEEAATAAATPRFKNRDNAQDRVCKAFVTLGALAGIDGESGTGPGDISEDLILAVQECAYNDPHFLGGPCCFHHAKSAAAVREIFDRAAPVSTALMDRIRQGGHAQHIAKAEAQLALIAAAKVWLAKTVRSP